MSDGEGSDKRWGRRRIGRFVSHAGLTIFIAAAALACGSKVTEQHYAEITSGMTEQEVERILGAPSDTKTLAIGSLSGTFATWKGKDGSTISIQFLNGKVAGKEFVKPGGRGAT